MYYIMWGVMPGIHTIPIIASTDAMIYRDGYCLGLCLYIIGERERVRIALLFIRKYYEIFFYLMFSILMLS